MLVDQQEHTYISSVLTQDITRLVQSGKDFSPTSWFQYTSASHVIRCTAQVGCDLVLVTVGQGRLTWVPRKPSIANMWFRSTLLGFQGAILPCSHLLGQGSIYRLSTEAPFFGECRRTQPIFGITECVGLRYKRLSATLWHCGILSKYRHRM